MKYGDAIIQGVCYMYPIFGMYSLHNLHVHKFVLFLDKSILNVSMSLTDFISFGIEFHIWFALYPNVSRPYDTLLGLGR